VGWPIFGYLLQKKIIGGSDEKSGPAARLWTEPLKLIPAKKMSVEKKFLR